MIRQPPTAAITGLLIALTIAISPAHSDDNLVKSTNFVRSLADRAIATLTAEGQTTENRREQFRILLRESFAIEGIARFALGRYWRSTSDAERVEYLALFEDTIVITWADRFSQYSGQAFVVQDAVDAPSAAENERAAIVHSTFFSDPQTPVRIDWRVASRGDLYKITDVSIEGMSMANTQRDEFASVIRNNGGQVSALLELLRQKQGVDRGSAG